MSAVKKRFCIFGCDALDAQGVPLHRFPDPEKRLELFAAWMSAIGDKLKGVDPNRMRNRRICDHHFDPASKLPKGRIVGSAIPKINLNRVHQTISSIVETDHSYCQPRREYLQSVTLADTTDLTGPSSAVENVNLSCSSRTGLLSPSMTHSGVVKVDNSYCQQKRKSLVDITNLLDSTLYSIPSGSSSRTCLTTTTKCHARTSPSKV